MQSPNIRKTIFSNSLRITFFICLISSVFILLSCRNSRRDHHLDRNNHDITDQSPNVSRNIDDNDGNKKEISDNSNDGFLTSNEKGVILYLNLARTNPAKFVKDYLSNYSGPSGYLTHPDFEKNKESLIEEMNRLTPLNKLMPDQEMFELAKCFATEGGKLGIIGHDRSQTGCSKGYMGECVQYGALEPQDIVLELLIDAGVPSLGHRKICLGEFSKIGVSIQYHKSYNKCAVLDFE